MTFLRNIIKLLQNCLNEQKRRMSSYLKRWAKIFIPFIGFASLIWFLIRVIPKPSRATYPCMRAAAPMASGFVIYLSGLLGSVLIFKNIKGRITQSHLLIAAALIFVGLFTGSLAFSQLKSNTVSNENIIYEFNDPLGPNHPIGEAKGIFPGRVIWVYDPNATNEKCIPYKWQDGYFLDKNCDQTVVDAMFSQGIQKLTGSETDEAAWEAVFHYFNKTHDKGDVGYSGQETIFIKINAVHAWGVYNDDRIQKNGYGNVDTSPQAILSMLRQLVNKAGVLQENIYIGDPYTNIFRHCYEKWSAEFPNIKYLSKNAAMLKGRTQLEASEKVGIYYSDKGTVLSKTNDNFFTCNMNADYVINIPAMKGHRWGGVTLFAKNHFGSNTRDGANHLHAGLHRVDYDAPLRTGYKKYRVMTDLMGNAYSGGKTLIYYLDALWSTSEEHLPPTRFRSAPFNNDWSSSLIFSLDPVAISSVAIDILQAEFKEEDEKAYPPRYAFVQWDGVDDYLHQAASSEWWPDGIKYDPENDGTPMKSLGVHEHWNNATDRQYSRNLGTGNGIELITIFNNATSVNILPVDVPYEFVLYDNYPNPFNPVTHIQYNIPSDSHVMLEVLNLQGEKVATLVNEKQSSGVHTVSMHGESLPSGIYFYQLKVGDRQITKRMTLIK